MLNRHYKAMVLEVEASRIKMLLSTYDSDKDNIPKAMLVKSRQLLPTRPRNPQILDPTLTESM